MRILEGTGVYLFGGNWVEGKASLQLQLVAVNFFVSWILCINSISYTMSGHGYRRFFWDGGGGVSFCWFGVWVGIYFIKQ